jgi:hypothetical protein
MLTAIAGDVWTSSIGYQGKERYVSGSSCPVLLMDEAVCPAEDAVCVNAAAAAQSSCRQVQVVDAHARRRAA